MRFHLEYGGLNSVKAYGGLTGIYQHRNRRSRFMRREGYMAVKNLQELRKLMKRGRNVKPGIVSMSDWKNSWV